MLDMPSKQMCNSEDIVNMFWSAAPRAYHGLSTMAKEGGKLGCREFGLLYKTARALSTEAKFEQCGK